MPDWGHQVAPLTGDELLLAVELGETCGSRNCTHAPTWGTAYVTGRAGKTSERKQKVCAEHAAQFAQKHGLVLTHEARRAADGHWDYEPEEDAEEAFPGRHRVKGGRNVHATRLELSGYVGKQVSACGETQKPMVPVGRAAAVTCPGCIKALAATDRQTAIAG